MRQLIARYLEHLADERIVSAHTLRAYRSDLERFLRFLTSEFLGREVDQIPPRDVDSLAVRSFLAAQARDGVGKRGARAQLERLAAFVGEDFVDPAWAEAMAATVRAPSSNWRELPEAEREALDAACRPGFELLAAAVVDPFTNSD